VGIFASTCQEMLFDRGRSTFLDGILATVFQVEFEPGPAISIKIYSTGSLFALTFIHIHSYLPISAKSAVTRSGRGPFW